MEHYLVSARKYRPSTFKSVVGQKALTTTLRNAVAQGRLAHSYLFCGSRGVGKTSCARIFAKAINCEHPVDGEPCNECASCRAFNEGQSLNIIELDAASNNGVENIRDLVDMTRNPPSTGRYRVFIVDEVHMLSSAAFNAFLKTLEEPPSYVIFILATTEKHKILPTILSRCQIYDFSRITIQDMIDHMAYVAQEEGIKTETAALNVIARQADGAMRDALSIFDQVAASSERNITYQSTIESLNVLDRSYYSRLLDKFLTGDVLGSWLIYKEIRDKGFDSHFFINGLADYFRDLMVAQTPGTLHLVEAGDDVRAELAAEAKKINSGFVCAAMSLLNDADLHYREAANKQFLTELTLAKICQLSSPSQGEDSHSGGRQLGTIAVNQAAAQAPATPSVSSTQPAAAGVAQPHNVASAPASAPASATAPSAPAATAPRPAQPASAPRVAQAPAARPTNTAAGKSPFNASPFGGGMRLTADKPAPKQAAQEEEPAQQTTATQTRTQSFTDEALIAAWDSFGAAHPTEHVLVNTMRTGRPQRIAPGGTDLAMTVENELQSNLMNEWSYKLLQHLRNALSNDQITLSVNLNEGQAAPAVWNEREVLDHLKERCPEINNYIRDFGLTIN